MSTNAKVSAAFSIKPGRSQNFLVAGAVAVIVSVICATILFVAGRNEGWGLLGFGLLTLIGCFIAWNKSQVVTDLENARPTELTLPDGTNLRTDSRLLRDPEGFRALGRIFDEMWSRKPLERPDGLVDSTGQVIPDSTDEAARLANEVNVSTQRLTNEVLDALGMSDKDAGRTQQAIDPAQPSPIPNIEKKTRGVKG